MAQNSYRNPEVTVKRSISIPALCVALLAGCLAVPCRGDIVITTGASANNRDSFDIATERFLLDTQVFQINGPLVFANAVGGNPGLSGTALDNPGTFAREANFIVLQNFDNNDTNGFPANWDNSFNARRALEAIAANTDGDRAGFFMYWNEGLGVNRLAYTSNLNNGAASLQILFAQNSANLLSNTVDLRDGGANVGLRGEANANFNLLSSFSASNVAVVPEPSSLAFLLGGVPLALLRRVRRRTA